MSVPRSEFKVVLPMDVWSRIVFAAKESPDARLAQMIEQAVMDAGTLDVTFKAVTP